MTEKKKKKYLYIYIAVVILLLVTVYLLPKVNDHMTRTMMVEHGTLSVADSVTGYVIRDEVVYTAGNSGKTEYNVKEGTKVRKTARIMKVKGDADGSESLKYSKLLNMLDNTDVKTTKYKAGINGVLSYHIDGYEGLLTPETMKKLEHSDVSNIVDDFTDLKREKVVEGDPVYKVYDNAKWYMLAWIERGSADRYAKGNAVTIRFNDADVAAKVYSKKELKDGSCRIILDSDRYYEKLNLVRAENVEIVTLERSGVIVDNTSIRKEDGKQGVYVRDAAGRYVFVPVNILLDNGEQSVLSERVYYDAEGKQVNTVDIYDEILRNPGRGE